MGKKISVGLRGAAYKCHSTASVLYQLEAAVLIREHASASPGGGCRTKTKMPASHTRVQVSTVPGPSPGKILFKKTPQVILMSVRVEIPWAGVLGDGP